MELIRPNSNNPTIPEILEIEGNAKVGQDSLIRIRGRNFLPDSSVVLDESISIKNLEILNSELLELTVNSSLTGAFPIAIKNKDRSSNMWGSEHIILSRLVQDSGWIDLRGDLSLAGEIVSYDNFLEETRNLANSGYYQDSSYGLARIYNPKNTNDSKQFLKFPDYKFTYQNNAKTSFIAAIFPGMIDIRVGLMPRDAENYHNNWTPQVIGIISRLVNWRPYNFTIGNFLNNVANLVNFNNQYNSYSISNPTFVKLEIEFNLNKNLKFKVFEIDDINNLDGGTFIDEEIVPHEIWKKYYNDFDYICPGFMARYTFDNSPASNCLLAFRVH